MKSAKNLYKKLVITLAVVLLASMGLLFGGWAYLFILSENTANAMHVNENMNKMDQGLLDLFVRYNKVLEKTDIIEKALPNDKDISGFLKDIEAVAKADNITILETNVGVTKGNDKSFDKAISQTIRKQDYNELNIGYSVKSKYIDLTNFLYDLRYIGRINNISSLSIATDTAAARGISDDINGDFILTIYVKK